MAKIPKNVGTLIEHADSASIDTVSAIVRANHARVHGNVESMNAHNAHIVGPVTNLHLHVQGDLEPSQLEKDDYHRRFIEQVNDRTRKNCSTRITGNFDNDVQEPITEVTPILVTTNFYKGGTMLEERNYSVVEDSTKKSNREIRRERKREKEIEVHLQDIHKHGRYIMLVGGAGSGKTTLIKRYVGMMLDKKIEILRDVKLVHLVNVRDLSERRLTPRDLLFGKLLPGHQFKAPVKYGFEWMQDKNNQKQIVFAFDGIDTAPWSLSGNHELINYDDEASAGVIMYNILCGQLFPNCRLLLTSREYAITQFPRQIRPDRIIALKGLRKNAIETLVKELGGADGENIWNHVQENSLNLMLLCSTPLFLVFTVIIHRECGGDTPDNLTGVFMTLLESHIHSEHAGVKDVEAVIDKLKMLSLKGIQAGTVVFTKEQIEEVGLDIEHVKDLVVGVPSPSENGVCRQRLLDDDYSFFFCHQAFQEALAALAIATSSLQFFENFAKDKLHKSYYAVVRQMLCGIMFNEGTAKLAEKRSQVQDKEAKRRCLLETLSLALKKSIDHPTDVLNLLISLRECGEEGSIIKMIRTNITKLSLSDIPLSASDLHAVAVVARQCISLDTVQLVNCHLEGSGLKILSDGLEGSDVKITVFDVSFNRNLRKHCMPYLYEICRRGRGLNYWQCGFKQLDILQFNETTADEEENTQEEQLSPEIVLARVFKSDNMLDCSCYNVETFHDCLLGLARESQLQTQPKGISISISDYTEETNVGELCNILRNIAPHVLELRIYECDFTRKQLKMIAEAFQNKKIDSLNIFLNHIEDDSWEILGKITRECTIRNLFFTACDLSGEKLRRFKTALREHEITKLDVSRNEMDKNTVEKLALIVEKYCIHELVMGYCSFTSERMKSLEQHIGRTKIVKIDMSGNTGMGVRGFSTLGNIAVKCGLEQLDISECDPSPEEIRSFLEAGKHAKIQKLNASRNTRMQESGLEDIGKLVHQCGIKELFIRQCALETKTLTSFLKGLGESKVSYLDLGCYFMKLRETTDGEIEIVKKLLRQVTHNLTLNGWDISETNRRDLQCAIDMLPYSGLKIVFNRGRNDFILQQNQDAC